MDREKLTQTLVGMNPSLPIKKAEEKTASLGRGILFFFAGLLLLAIGFGLPVLVIFVQREVPGLPLLAFSALPVLAGVYLIFAGGNIASTEAMRAAERSGGFLTKTIARAVKVVRKGEGA